MEYFAKDDGTDPEALSLMWEQKKYSEDSKMYNIIERKIGMMLGERYAYIRDRFAKNVKGKIQLNY